MALAGYENKIKTTKNIELETANGRNDSSITDNDPHTLLIAQERTLANLEALNRELAAERDMLRRQCVRQIEKIQSLESAGLPKPVIRQQGSRPSVSQEYPDNHRPLGRRQPAPPIESLPCIDASEFLPVVDIPEKKNTIQRLVSLSSDLVRGAAALKASSTDVEPVKKAD